MPGQIDFQGAAPPITDETEFFHIRIWFPIVPAICLFVLGLLIFCSSTAASSAIAG